MQYTAAVLAFVGAVAAQSAVTTIPGTFEIEVINATTVAKRSTPLVLTLTNGVLKDAENRYGYIASNYQFQFDNPVQPNSQTNGSGWSAFSNSTLALDGSSVFYECLSGGFFNLYDESVGGQCSPIYFGIINRSSQAVSQISDGQVTGTPVSQITDGQPQATTGVPVTQISDGQIQATTGVPITQISDGQIQAPTGTPITQISDGQIQAPTGTPVTQISDGQIQAPTGTPITQISDGQVQAPTGTPVTQISDGQIQAPAPTSAPSAKISAKPSKVGTVSSVGSLKPTTTLAAFTGAAMPTAVRGEFFGLAAGVLAAALL